MEAEAKSRIHPLVATAAIAVIVLCAVAVAAITGYLPGSSAQKSSEPAAAALTAVPPVPAPAAAPATPVAAAPAALEPTPAPRPKPAQAPVAKPSAPKAPVVAAAPAQSAPQVVPAAQPVPAAPPIAKAKPVCVDCGVVTGVSEVQVRGEGSGLGAVAGGVAGAVVGNQVGSGGTRTIARIAGAAGGAYAGHEIEKRSRTHKKFDVGVKLDDGSLRTVSYESPPTWRAGDRVRIVNGTLEPAN